MLEEVGARSDPEVTAILRDKTKFCPKCERKMVLKTAKRTGRQFWGCPSFPDCDGIWPAA
jgi:ssDNA-binding Zn-finger/Zn-ribbon topoisomerase 1